MCSVLVDILSSDDRQQLRNQTSRETLLSGVVILLYPTLSHDVFKRQQMDELKPYFQVEFHQEQHLMVISRNFFFLVSQSQ